MFINMFIKNFLESLLGIGVGSSALISASSIAALGKLYMDEIDEKYEKEQISFSSSLFLESLPSTSITSTLAAVFTDMQIQQEEIDVQNTSMIVESMNLEELYELRDLVDEKGNKMTYHY